MKVTQMMKHSLLLLLTITSFLLAACAPPTAPIATQTAIADAPTAAVTTEPTALPTSATTAPEPTGAPTQAATLEPEPTSAPTEVATTEPTQVPATAQPTDAASTPQSGFGSEILFLREGNLIALDVATRKERTIADTVADFTATPDGKMITLVRTEETETELWSVRRDGSALTQLTRNDRTETTPSWAPDGSALVFASAAQDAGSYTREWQGWSQWCAGSEVHILALPDGAETALGPGCDPAFGPDGKRIVYATPPTQMGSEPQTNTIRLVNRQGQNGWSFAKADGAEAATNAGRLVYAPTWSPDSGQIVYHRFLGYQALVDINLSEMGKSFEGKGQPISTGAGWMLPARFTPDGRTVALSENNYSDARGFGGYDNWSTVVIKLEGSRDVALPSGSVTMIGQQVDLLPRAQQIAWSPDGATLAVQLPPGWQPGLSNNEPFGIDEVPGELWLWQPGNAPQERIAENVSFASPIVWLPAGE
jgi:dipeptidyl aminopeptidase/acylaminoacyl peptidase